MLLCIELASLDVAVGLLEVGYLGLAILAYSSVGVQIILSCGHQDTSSKSAHKFNLVFDWSLSPATQ